MEHFSARLPEVFQVDWASFFFCRSEQEARQITAEEPMHASMTKSLFTLRAVDNTYFYLYLPEERFDRRVLEELQSRFSHIEIKTDTLDHLDFPH